MKVCNLVGSLGYQGVAGDVYVLQFYSLFKLKFTFLIGVKFTKHTINHFMCAVQGHLVHSQCCVTATSLWFQNFIGLEKHPVSIK